MRSLSTFASTLETVPAMTDLKLSSIPFPSVTPLFVTLPPKYLLLIAIVRLTRLPSVFASSEFHLSTMRS